MPVHISYCYFSPQSYLPSRETTKYGHCLHQRQLLDLGGAISSQNRREGRTNRDQLCIKLDNDIYV